VRKYVGPHLHRSTRDYRVVAKVTCYDESFRGDNPAWEARSRPLLRALVTPMTLDEIKRWARQESWPIMMTEEALYWLEARELVERVDGKWRVVNV
jgi:hypothetical protein